MLHGWCNAWVIWLHVCAGILIAYIYIYIYIYIYMSALHLMEALLLWLVRRVHPVCINHWSSLLIPLHPGWLPLLVLLPACVVLCCQSHGALPLLCAFATLLWLCLCHTMLHLSCCFALVMLLCISSAALPLSFCFWQQCCTSQCCAALLLPC